MRSKRNTKRSLEEQGAKPTVDGESGLTRVDMSWVNAKDYKYLLNWAKSYYSSRFTKWRKCLMTIEIKYMLDNGILEKPKNAYTTIGILQAPSALTNKVKIGKNKQ